MASELAVRTSAPLMPLSRMVSGTGLITRHDGHHLVTGLDEESMTWMAKTLAILGHDVDVVEVAH